VKSQFSHELFLSFMLWFEKRLASTQGSAYITNQSNVFSYTDGFNDIPTSHRAYQGRFRGLVQEYDVTVPNSGIFINGGFVTGSNTGIYIDYLNGRVIVPAASGASLNITANNTIKEIQVYDYPDDEEQLILSSDFVDFTDQTTTYLTSQTNQVVENTYLLPACFLRYVTTENDYFSFGGEMDSQTRIRAVVIAKDNYLIDGVLSLFADTKGSCIARVPFENYPYGVFNSIKSFPYSYNSFVSGFGGKTFIDNVNTSKLDYSISMNKLEKNILVGFIDFDLSTFRVPA
jgi:hypothetical protein